VVDVPPKLSARVRVLSSFAGNARKNDELDALATALATSRTGRLAAVDPEDSSEVLRLLSERREDLVAERTRALNRLHGLLRDLVPGGVAGTLSAPRAARILRGIRPKGTSARLRRRLASEILRDVRTLDRKIADLNRRIEAEVEASGTTLTQIFGIGPILAARIIGTVGDVGRFPTKAHYFASYSGTAPLEASSGEAVRHRLTLAGNRHLNYALHMVAVCQARSDARGGAYYRKKMAEGKSRKEALRCLKRRVCDAVFRNLVADSQAHSRSAA
jgi:transposase